MPILILIAVSLSMDAFSLALAYGTLNINKRDVLILSIIVGVFHFFMPLLGNYLGCSVVDKFIDNTDMLVFIILSFIGVSMIIDSFKKEKDVKVMGYVDMLLFGLAVSIDSFSVGIGIDNIYNNITISIILISLSAFMFTFVGLNIGKRINSLIGSISTTLGGVMLILIALMYLL